MKTKIKAQCKFYKVRHKASGLFFKPSTGMDGLNVSVLGKVYQRMPTAGIFHHRVNMGYNRTGWSRRVATNEVGYENLKELTADFNPDEWEIVQYLTSETVIGW